MVLVGVPLVVLSRLVALERGPDMLAGPQPGGLLAGEVHSAEGTPIADHPVRALAGAPNATSVPLAETTTDAAGAFAIEVPPHEGYYLLEAGGGQWQRLVRTVAAAGGTLPRTTFELQPGCTLALTIERASGEKVGKGTLWLDGEVETGRYFGLFATPVHLEREIPAGELVLDGLPPMSAELRIELAEGVRIHDHLDLEPGRTERRYELD